MKEIRFDREVREKIEAGVQKLADAVSSTLGAKGGNVLFHAGKNQFVSTKDGVTVAQQVFLADPVENAAAQVVKDAAARTARDAGDGTTTATVLANAIVRESMRYIAAGANPMDIKRGIDMAVDKAIEYIDQIKEDVADSDDIYNIARISANNDPEIGKMILDVFEKVGKNGAVRLEETQANETVVDVIDGCQILSGYMSPNFINNQVKRTVDYEDALVLITDKFFQGSFQELKPAIELVLEKANEIGSPIPLVIIAAEMEGEVLGTLVLNKVRNKLPFVAIRAPEFGKERAETLEDIAVLTGGTVISEDKGLKIADVKPEHFGYVDRVVIDEFTTTFFGRKGKQELIDERVASIEVEIEKDREKKQEWRLKRRLATLTGGIGVIYVGGGSEAEMKDSYFRIEDSLAATKAALDDGYVAGGGVAYLRASNYLTVEKILSEKTDTALGFQTLLNGLKSPLKTIAENAGINGDVVLDKASKKDLNYGYDALTDSYGNMVKKGIIDPAKVVKAAIRNAASVAGILITTKCVINDPIK